MSRLKHRTLKFKSGFFSSLIGLIGLAGLFVFSGCHRHQPVRPKPQPVKYGGPPTSYRKSVQVEKNISEKYNPFSDLKS